MIWRYIHDDHVDAAFGLAADEYMASAVGRGISEPVLRLYTYADYAALVGRFQDVENEIQLAACRENGVRVNRRPTGGGAIFMGHGQLGVALCVPGRQEDTYGRARELMARFSEGIIRGLNRLGVQARFRRKNDIEVEGRKIAGLGIYRDNSGGLLFHSSILLDMDIPMMLRVLQTPFEKLSDKAIHTVDQRITTIRRETGRESDMEQVRQAICAGYREVFKSGLEESDFTHAEREAIAQLKKEKYESESWIFQKPAVKDAVGAARIKTPAGLLEARVTLAGTQIKALYILGDFFVSEKALADVEGHFRWHGSAPEQIDATLHLLYEKHGGALASLPADALRRAIRTALDRARIISKKAADEPYGCFVTPGGNVHV
ncbi:MAG: lipoate--protein ligase family protein [Calditrichaeota bacterium]|nr:MAG: lipoate--protein ligase family protein [Calditrichota bacterium]